VVGFLQEREKRMMMDGLSGKRDIKIDGCFLDLHEGPIGIGKYLSSTSISCFL
jgi:hypothetical protein